jgi:phosphoribosylanthranilate isomerase
MIRIKICGLEQLEDARYAADAGADMLGFHLSKRSLHYIDPAKAATICDALRQELGESCPLLVGIFINELVSTITGLANKVGIDAIQLSGDESDSIIKELRIPSFKSVQPMNKIMALDDIKYYSPHFQHDDRLPSLLLDPYFTGQAGGEEASKEMVAAAKEDVPRLMVTGGFTPENVAARLQEFQPWGVDVNKGIEVQLNDKDQEKIKAFIDAAISV